VLALLLLLSTPAPNKAPTTSPELRHVTAIGEAEVRAKADQAVIQLQIEQRSVSATTAEAAHRRQLDQIRDRLQNAGVEGDRIQIGQPSVRELPQVVNGLSWTVQSEMRVTVRDLTKLATVLETFLNDPGSRIEAVEYGLANPELQVQKALEAAVANAQSRAETIAGGTSGRLGAPVSIEMLGAPVIQGETADVVRLKLSVKAIFPM
jgi:uncharacterized protein YggE